MCYLQDGGGSFTRRGEQRALLLNEEHSLPFKGNYCSPQSALARQINAIGPTETFSKHEEVFPSLCSAQPSTHSAQLLHSGGGGGGCLHNTWRNRYYSYNSFITDEEWRGLIKVELLRSSVRVFRGTPHPSPSGEEPRSITEGVSWKRHYLDFPALGGSLVVVC